MIAIKDLAELQQEFENRNRELAERALELLGEHGLGGLVQWYCRHGAADSIEQSPAAKRIARTLLPSKNKKKRVKRAAAKPSKPRANTKGGTRAELAEWRRKILAPVLKYKRGSADRTAALQSLAEQTIKMPDGTSRQFTQSSIYAWIKQIEQK